jgi:hypothetical protein
VDAPDEVELDVPVAPDEVELDVSVEGWKIDRPIGYPCDVMAAR